jgi:hypothetical protein
MIKGIGTTVATLDYEQRSFIVREFHTPGESISYVWDETAYDQYDEPLKRVGTSSFVPVGSIPECLEDLIEWAIRNPGPDYGRPYTEQE